MDCHEGVETPPTQIDISHSIREVKAAPADAPLGNRLVGSQTTTPLRRSFSVDGAADRPPPPVRRMAATSDRRCF
jgi:hypothetical protein